MEHITERRLRHIIRETLGEESAGLGPATGPAAEQEGEFDPPPGPSKHRPKPDKWSVIDALSESSTFDVALHRFVAATQSVIKRELAGRVPNLSRSDVDFALQLDGDFDMSLTNRVLEEIAEVLIEELPFSSPS